MLLLSRKNGEAVQIGDNIVVKVVQSSKGCVKLLFDAPREVPIMRRELLEQSRSAGEDSQDDEDTGYSVNLMGI